MKFGEFKSGSSEIALIEWFSKLISILEKFELKAKRYKLRKLSRTIPDNYLRKHVVTRYMEHQDCFYFYFKNELLKKFRASPLTDQDAVILANLNIDNSDSASDASSSNNNMRRNKIIRKVLIHKNKILIMNRTMK